MILSIKQNIYLNTLLFIILIIQIIQSLVYVLISLKQFFTPVLSFFSGYITCFSLVRL